MSEELARREELRELHEIAASIHGRVVGGNLKAMELFDERVALGHELLEAREHFKSDNEFGQWIEQQDFGFSRQWRNVLMWAARYEAPFRKAVSSQLDTGGGQINFEKLVGEVRAALEPPKEKPAKPKPAPEPEPEPAAVEEPPDEEIHEAEVIEGHIGERPDDAHPGERIGGFLEEEPESAGGEAIPTPSATSPPADPEPEASAFVRLQMRCMRAEDALKTVRLILDDESLDTDAKLTDIRFTLEQHFGRNGG